MILRRLGTVAVLALIAMTGCDRPRWLALRKKEVKPEVAETKNAKPETYTALGNFYFSESFTKDMPAELREDKRLKARLSYEKALSVDPKNLAAMRGIAEILHSQGETKLAIDTSRSALKIYPNDPVLWMTLGKSLAQAKDWHNGINSMKKAVELAPRNRHFVRTLGYSLAWAGATEESVATFTKVMKESEARYEVARILHARKDNQQAMKELQAAIEQKPTFTQAHKLMAQIQQEGGGNDFQRVNHEAPSYLINNR